MNAAWLRNRPVLLLLCSLSALRVVASARSLEGRWSGEAELAGSSLPFTLELRQTAQGWSGTMTCADLLMARWPVRSLQIGPDHIRWQLPDADAPLTFSVSLTTNDELRGTAQPVPEPVASEIKAGGGTPQLHVRLRRTAPEPELPFHREEIRIPGRQVKLAGEVWAPLRPGRKPGVVLLHGSRTNERFYYYAYAESFARAGFVVLAYDKRGSGQSTGNYAEATYDDLVEDALAAVQALRQRADVEPRSVGIWGLSQGAFLAPWIAARSAEVAFLVAVSAPGVTVGETAAYQDRLRVLRRGFSPAEADTAADLHRALTAWVRTGQGREALAQSLRKIADAPWRAVTGLPPQLPSAAELRGWYWGGRAIDPLPWWTRVRVPVLLVYGGNDDLVSAQESLKAITATLQRSGNQNVQTLFYPQGDHLMRITARPTGQRNFRFDWPRAVRDYLPAMTRWMQQVQQPAKLPVPAG